MSELIYLASPYSHLDESVRERRFQRACEASAVLMWQGLFVFSPIAHSHPIALTGGLPLGFDYWKKYDEIILGRCDVLIILMLEGWKDSIGIKGEMCMARNLHKPIFYMRDITNK